MKKMLATLAIISGIALVLSGCAQGAGTSGGSGSGTATGPSATTAPDMGTAESVTSVGATSAPASTTEATALYSSASSALSSFLSSTNAVASIKSDLTPSFAVTSNTTPYNYKGTGKNGGTIDITGSSTSSSDPGEKLDSSTAKPNTSYNVGSSSVKATVSGNITGIVTDKDSKGYTYTINGKLSEAVDFSLDMKCTTGTDMTNGSDATFNMNLAYLISYGTAFSIKRNDGVGAKFIITYKADYTKKNLIFTMAEWSKGASASWTTDLMNYFYTTKATLTVYDDKTNAQLYTTDLPLSQIPTVVSVSLQ